jgi:hypothetical protein
MGISSTDGESKWDYVGSRHRRMNGGCDGEGDGEDEKSYGIHMHRKVHMPFLSPAKEIETERSVPTESDASAGMDSRLTTGSFNGP